MSLGKSGPIHCSACHFPAYSIHFIIHIDRFPPCLNEADAKSSLEGAAICPVITIQILKIPRE